MSRILYSFAFVINLMPLNQVFAGSVVEAKTDKVSVYSEADKKSKVLKTLKKGESLPSKDRKGMYWQVSLDGGKTGFVSVMSVKRMSIEADDKLASALRDAVQQSRDAKNDNGNIRSRSAVMGVRGLDEEKDLKFVGNVKPNLRMVFSMEEQNVDKKSLEKLGEAVFKEIEGKMN